MTLTIFQDAEGLWLRDGEADGVLPFCRSSVDISVSDGMGNVLDGTLTVNGTPFPVKRGKCKLLTEALSRYGRSDIEFVSAGGVKRKCSCILQRGEDAWCFPEPVEALENATVLTLLRKLERLREKLASAKALYPEAISGVLGI